MAWRGVVLDRCAAGAQRGLTLDPMSGVKPLPLMADAKPVYHMGWSWPQHPGRVLASVWQMQGVGSRWPPPTASSWRLGELTGMLLTSMAVLRGPWR